MTKNADIVKYKHSGYGIGFDRKGSQVDIGVGKKVIMFGVDMNSSPHILTLDKSSTQGLEHRLTVEKIYSIDFTENKKKVCLSLHYNGGNSYLFVNDTEIIQSKWFWSCSNSIMSRKHFKRLNWVEKWKKNWLNGYVYDFSCDYDAIAVDDILNIHKYLMKKNNMM